MRVRRVVSLAAVLVAGATVVACGSSDDGGDTTSGGGDGGGKVVRIGMSAALEGAYAAYDQPFVDGMKFAEKQINARGGIDGYRVELTVKNNKGDQTQTATTVQELLEDGIRAHVLTAADSSVAAGQLAAQSGAIVSAGANTAPAIVEGVGERGFMLNFGDNGQAAAAAEYACGEGYRSAYVIGSEQIPYTKFIPEYFEQAFASGCDGSVTTSESYRLGQTSFSALVAKIAGATPKPDVIFTPMFVPDFGAFMKQLRSAGVDTPVLTTDGNAAPLLLDSAGNAADGVVITAGAFPADGNATERFVAEYRSTMGKAPESDSIAAIGRDNVYAIVEAAAAARSTEPDAILDAIYAFRDHPLVSGAVTMDRERQVPDKDIVLLRVQDGGFRLLDELRPRNVPTP